MSQRQPSSPYSSPTSLSPLFHDHTSSPKTATLPSAAALVWSNSHIRGLILSYPCSGLLGRMYDRNAAQWREPYRNWGGLMTVNRETFEDVCGWLYRNVTHRFPLRPDSHREGGMLSHVTLHKWMEAKGASQERIAMYASKVRRLESTVALLHYPTSIHSILAQFPYLHSWTVLPIGDPSFPVGHVDVERELRDWPLVLTWRKAESEQETDWFEVELDSTLLEHDEFDALAAVLPKGVLHPDGGEVIPGVTQEMRGAKLPLRKLHVNGDEAYHYSRALGRDTHPFLACFDTSDLIELTLGQVSDTVGSVDEPFCAVETIVAAAEMFPTIKWLGIHDGWAGEHPSVKAIAAALPGLTTLELGDCILRSRIGGMSRWDVPSGSLDTALATVTTLFPELEFIHLTTKWDRPPGLALSFSPFLAKPPRYPQLEHIRLRCQLGHDTTPLDLATHLLDLVSPACEVEVDCMEVVVGPPPDPDDLNLDYKGTGPSRGAEVQRAWEILQSARREIWYPTFGKRQEIGWRHIPSEEAAQDGMLIDV